MSNSFAFRVGVPAEDASFLLSGFSVAQHKDGESWRNCSRVFRINVPRATTGETRITLRMRFIDPCLQLDLFALGQPLAAIAPAGTSWQDHSFTLPAAGGSGKRLLTVTGKLDREPFWPPSPKIAPDPSCVDLSRVTAESADGSDIAVPEDCTRERIAQSPVKLANFPAAADKANEPGPPAAAKTIFFGDLHVHTNYSVCGRPNNGTLEENVAAAKQLGHDFLAITDHSEHMDLESWQRYFDEIQTFAAKYDILILPAVEWTSRAHGHRNVYFLQARPPYMDYFMFETDHPGKLAGFFRKHELDAFAVPHHFPYVNQPGNIGSIAPEAEPLIEIYSGWGSSEHHGARLQDSDLTMPGCTVQDALARGLKLGFVGGSDGHNSMAGSAGMTAVLAESLCLEHVFAALRSRLCYATSGGRVLLNFHVNGYPMGSILTVNQYTVDKLFPLEIAASVLCPGPADRLELVCNGEVIHTAAARENAAAIRLSVSADKLASPGGSTNALNQHLTNFSRYYYVRVGQDDGGMAWSSPIWIDFVPGWD